LGEKAGMRASFLTGSVLKIFDSPGGCRTEFFAMKTVETVEGGLRSAATHINVGVNEIGKNSSTTGCICVYI
jgi:hypothetical protein